MKRTKTLKILLIIFWAVVLLATAGIFWLKKNQSQPTNIQTFGSPTSSVDTSDWKTYKDKEHGFSFKYPNDWTLQKDTNGTVYLTSPDAKEKQNLEQDPSDTIFFNYYDSLASLNTDWHGSNNPKTIDELIINMGWKLKGHKDVAGVSAIEFLEGAAGGNNLDFVFENQNYIYLIQSIGKDQLPDIENQIISTFQFISPFICTTEPQSTDIGRPEYPRAEEYKNLEFLGQVFTAANCGKKRLNQIFGVKDGNYTLGSKITLQNNPSSQLISVLKSIGYKCSETDTSDTNCQEWEIFETVRINDLLRLEPYASEIKSDDCTICG